MRKITTLALATMMLVSATTIFAQVPAQSVPTHSKGQHVQMMRQMMQELNLSKGQMDQIKGIREETKAKMAKVKASNASIDHKRAEAKQIHMHSREKMLSVLNPAQRQKFQSMRAAMKARHGGIKA